jgi:hypothetical protein
MRPRKKKIEPVLSQVNKSPGLAIVEQPIQGDELQSYQEVLLTLANWPAGLRSDDGQMMAELAHKVLIKFRKENAEE